MSALARRIRDRLKELGKNPTSAAAEVGLSIDGIRNILRGKSDNPRRDTLEKIAKACEWTVPQLLGLVTASEIVSPPKSRVQTSGLVEINGSEFATIGRYDVTLSAGPGSMLEQYPEPLGYHLVERHWLADLTRTAPQHLAVVQVGNDSMFPTLHDRDWVLVDLLQKRFSREGIYALAVGEDGWIKRLSLNLAKRLIRIISDNALYPMQELPEDQVRVIGRVIGLVSRRLG